MKQKLGLVGCGRWGKNILRDLLTLGCEVFVADVSPEAREQALKLGATEVSCDLQELPNNLDGLVVATPTAQHFATIDALLERGVPIFCEKPITADITQARNLVQRAPEKIFIMDKWRYHPGIEALASLVAEGSLGQIQYIRTRRLQWGNPHKDVDGVWILAPHDLVIVRQILGKIPTPRAAFGELVGQNLNGITAFLGETPGAVIEVSVRHPIRERLILVAGTTGIALLDNPLADHIKIYREGKQAESIYISQEFPLLRELRHFCQFLAGGEPPLTNAKAALEVVEVITQIRALAMQAYTN